MAHTITTSNGALFGVLYDKINMCPDNAVCAVTTMRVRQGRTFLHKETVFGSMLAHHHKIAMWILLPTKGSHQIDHRNEAAFHASENSKLFD
jgi:hypothetical protein